MENKKQITFKLYYNKPENHMIYKDKLERYKNFSEFKKDLIHKSALGKFADHKFKGTDKIVLNLREDIINLIQLKYVFNNDSFEYLIEKIKKRKINNVVYFDAEKVQAWPDWKKPSLEVILKNSLEESIKKMKNSVKESLNLKILEDASMTLKNQKKEIEQNENENLKNIHKGILCNNCFNFNFQGKRFICAECANYNLCENCEKLIKINGIQHSIDHVFIMCKNPIDFDSMAFSNIISPNEIILMNEQNAIDVEINILNNGEEDLQNCYIISTRYNMEEQHYLSCMPVVINDTLKINEIMKIKINIKIPNETLNPNNIEGYFRMFTPKGIPFGDVLKVKIINESTA